MTSTTSRPAAILAVAIGLAAGFLLCGYELIRAPSTSLYIGAFGASRLPYAMFGGTALTLLLLVGYGWRLSRAGPRRTLFESSMVAALVIAGCYAATLWGSSRVAAFVAYAFREAYIVLIIEQYWSFINSTYREGEARRFNGLICGLGSLGAVSGGFAAKYLADAASPLFAGTDALLLLSAACLVPAAIASDLAYRQGGEPAPAAVPSEGRPNVLALRLFAESGYLRRIGLLIVLTQVVSTALDLGFFSVVETALPYKDLRTAYIGGFYGRLNLTAALLQFVVTPLLLRRLPLRAVLPAIPVLHAATAVVVLMHPSLATAGAAFLIFKAVDYSVFRAGKEMFYMPLSFDSRYRAKEVIDAFGYRAAKGLAAGASSVARSLCGALPFAVYPVTVIVSAGLWLVTVVQVTREHHQLVADHPGPAAAPSAPESV